MKRVCFVHNVDVVGGAERMSQAIMKGLPNLKYESHLVCPAKGDLSEQCENLGVKPHFHDMQQPDFKEPIKSIKSFFNWHQLIKSNNFDIFHTGDLISTRSLLNVASKNNVEVICHIHFPFEQPFADWVFKKGPKPKGFIFCSQELQDDVGPKLSLVCPDAKQWVVHNGVNTSRFVPNNQVNPLLKIGIIANLQFRKGHDDFLTMAKKIINNGHKVQFEIIGGDILEEPREDKLKQLAKELKIEQYTNFHGQVDNVLEHLQKLDIVVCASHQEAFPVSILEAMACEKPVVSTNVNGIPEAIVDGVTGFMVNPFSPDELALKTIELIESKSMRHDFGKKARARVEKNFSEESYLNKIIDIYNQ